MRLKVMLPTERLVDEEVTKVIAEGSDGSFCLLPKHLKDAVQQGQRPLPCVDRLGRAWICGFQAIAAFSGAEVERKMPASTAPFLRPGSIPFVDQVVLEGCQQKRSKTASFARYVSKVLLFQQAREEALRKILGRGGIVPLTTHERVERIPVGFTQYGQGISSFD